MVVTATTPKVDDATVASTTTTTNKSSVKDYAESSNSFKSNLDPLAPSFHNRILQKSLKREQLEDEKERRNKKQKTPSTPEEEAERNDLKKRILQVHQHLEQKAQKECNFFAPPESEFEPDRALTSEDEAMATKIGTFVARKINKHWDLRTSMFNDITTSKDYRTKFLYMKEDSEDVYYDDDIDKFREDFENFEMVGTKYEHIRHIWNIDEIRNAMVDGTWGDMLYKRYTLEEEKPSDSSDEDDDDNEDERDDSSNVEVAEMTTGEDLEQWAKDRIDWFAEYAKVYMTNPTKCELYCPFSHDDWAVYWNNKLGLPGTKHLHGFGAKLDKTSNCGSVRKFLVTAEGEKKNNSCLCKKCHSFYMNRVHTTKARKKNTLDNHILHYQKEGFCLMHWGLKEVHEKVHDHIEEVEHQKKCN